MSNTTPYSNPDPYKHTDGMSGTAWLLREARKELASLMDMPGYGLAQSLLKDSVKEYSARLIGAGLSECVCRIAPAFCEVHSA